MKSETARWPGVLVLVMNLAMLVLVWAVFAKYVYEPEAIVIEEPIKIDEQHAHPGGALTLVIHYTKDHEAASETGLFLAREGQIVALPTFMTALPVGSHRIKVSVPLPEWVPAGRYRAYMVRESRHAFVPSGKMLFETETFEVRPEP